MQVFLSMYDLLFHHGNCEIKVCELDLEKSKNSGKIANEQIFIAFIYLWTLFKFGTKSHKIEDTFKMHY